MRVVVIAQRPADGRFGRLVPDLVAALSLFGAQVGVVDPDVGCLEVERVAADADVYVLTSASEAAFSLAGALHLLGAHLVNPYPVAVALSDGLVLSRALSAAGIQVPQSWVTLQPLSLQPHLADGSLVLSTTRGRGGARQVVRDVRGLAAVPTGAPWLATRHHEAEGPVLRVFRIGPELFGVEQGAGRDGKRLVELSADLRDTALRCGEVFGIAIYSIDVVRAQGRHWVLDMSAFPDYEGVPRAGRRISGTVIEEVRGRVPTAGRTAS